MVNISMLTTQTIMFVQNLEPAQISKKRSMIGDSQPDPYPQYVVLPQYNPTSGSIFSNDPSVTSFTNTFIQLVYNSPILREAFDISELRVSQYSQLAYKYNLDMLSNYGLEDPASLAEFSIRAIVPNFDVLTMAFMTRFKANLAANFLFVEGILTIDNAERLALKYAQTVENYARIAMTADPTSKFEVLTESFIDFVRSVDDNAIAMTPLMVFYYGNEWFVAAVNYKWLYQW
ncbi:hypothetical protein AVEN_28769-1 [Araneus ventricosus]|uniref:Uncharacterized protein n=1 Tax=Araneus ventricosus TaxID=182803 RepID=A0A4Y2QCL2_ARAVE|nr:hypothetical protein AVEN_28769-1 [Araneus ventricosus]